MTSSPVSPVPQCNTAKNTLLTIDIGNTNVTLGVFARDAAGQFSGWHSADAPLTSESRLRHTVMGPHWRLTTNSTKTADEYCLALLDTMQLLEIDATAIAAVALASVVPALTPMMIEACRKAFALETFVADAAVRTGLTSRYDDARQLGADRIVDAAAAYHLYGGPICVIDFGTATTFDAVTAAGEYLGGAIVPGLGISAEALFARTAKLPQVEYKRPPSVIGRNIRHSLQAGLLYGYVSLVDGMITRFRAELGQGTKVIATGGLAEIIARETAAIDVIAPWLMLEGLCYLYNLNQTTR